MRQKKKANEPKRVDYLRGFKENVIMGHIVPAVPVSDHHRKKHLKPLAI